MQIFCIRTQVYMSNMTNFTSAGSLNITDITDILYANECHNECKCMSVCVLHEKLYMYVFILEYNIRLYNLDKEINLMLVI